MSVTPSFNLSRSLFGRILAVGLLLSVPVVGLPQAVPSQANIDASAQRRLQETAQEAQRQRRMENQVRNVSPALFSEKLAGPGGPVLARKALAALVRLREEGLSPDEAIHRATRSSGIDSAQAAEPAAYLRKLFIQKSGQITPAILAKLEAGEDPAPDLVLSPFVP
jgi:hypothetical protein